MKQSNYRWVICFMLFMATTVNYMDRQVLSLTWKDFIAPEFHWTDSDYGNVAAIFSLVYAVANLFSGRFIDWIGTRKGYLWSIGIWSLGACMHAVCAVATVGWLHLDSTQELFTATGTLALSVASVSSCFFIAARIVLAVGESGNFPSAVKVTAEYFLPRDRAYATSLFNAGATVGALASPLCIPILASYFRSIGWGNGWEMAFIIIGALGFIWMGAWLLIYKKPEPLPAEETATETAAPGDDRQGTKKLTFAQIVKLPETWGIFLGRVLTDGVWWFFLFWTPAYISDVYGYPSDHPMAVRLIFVLYLITMLSILGGKLPTLLMQHTGCTAFQSHKRALLLFALVPLLALFAQPLGTVSPWLPVCIIGLAGAAHQAWSANMYTVSSDLFPPSAIGTLTGICGMAGGISSFAINKVSGQLFDYADATHMQFMGFEGKPAGYFIIFIYCSVAYLLGWVILRVLTRKC